MNLFLRILRCPFPSQLQFSDVPKKTYWVLFPSRPSFPKKQNEASLAVCLLAMKQNQSVFQFYMTSLNYEANESNRAPGKWKQPLC